jgi:hypothetical protein
MKKILIVIFYYFWILKLIFKLEDFFSDCKFSDLAICEHTKNSIKNVLKFTYMTHI